MIKYSTPCFARRVMKVLIEEPESNTDNLTKKEKESVVADAHGRIFGDGYKEKTMSDDLKMQSRELCKKMMDLMGVPGWEDEEKMLIWREWRKGKGKEEEEEKEEGEEKEGKGKGKEKEGKGKGKEKEGKGKGKEKEEGEKETNFRNWAIKNLPQVWEFFHCMLEEIEKKKKNLKNKEEQWRKQPMVRFFFSILFFFFSFIFFSFLFFSFLSSLFKNIIFICN